MDTIEYQITEGLCLTPCPHGLENGDMRVMVGSSICTSCPCYFGMTGEKTLRCAGRRVLAEAMAPTVSYDTGG